MPALSKLYTKKQIDKIREELIEKHGNFCSVCKKPRSAFKNNLSVDHRHSDGLIRGLLCYYCNRRLVGQLTVAKILPVVLYLIKYEIGESTWEKFGKMLSDLKIIIK